MPSESYASVMHPYANHTPVLRTKTLIYNTQFHIDVKQSQEKIKIAKTKMSQERPIGPNPNQYRELA